MGSILVTLRMGPTFEMQMLRGLLEANGIRALVEDSNTKTIDPFITGPLSFDARLVVAEDTVEAAESVIAEAQESGTEAVLAETVPAEELDAAREELAAEPDEAARMAELARRIRWAALLFWLHPFLYANAASYLAWHLRTGERAEGHRATLQAMVYAVLLDLALLLFLIEIVSAF